MPGRLIPVMLDHQAARDPGLMDPAPALYTIRINGHLGATVLSAFPALMPQRHGAHTILTGSWLRHRVSATIGVRLRPPRRRFQGVVAVAR
jgi:hypothetical protein